MTEQPDVRDLFSQFNAARAAGDMQRANELAAQMKQQEGPVRFGAMSDAELEAEIEKLTSLVDGSGQHQTAAQYFNTDHTVRGRFSLTTTAAMMNTARKITANDTLPTDRLKQLQAEKNRRKNT